MLLTLITFLIIIVVLVLVHELGHFLAAKKVGVWVEEFAVGFKPRIWGKKIGETLYAINAVPLGGYVKLYGENGEDTSKDSKHRSLASKTIAQRFFVMVAGASMNIILGWFILTILFIVGFQPLFPGIEKDKLVDTKPATTVSEVTAGSPAQVAGLKSNDVITSVDGQRLGVVEFVSYIDAHKGQSVTLVISRNNVDTTVVVTPRVNPPAGQGALGVSLDYNGVAKTAWYKAPIAGVVETGRMIGQSVVGFVGFVKTLIVHQQVSNDVTGIIGIGELTGVARRLGFAYLMQLVIAITIGLGVVNLMPFLPLDGGHILMLAYEKIARKKPSEEIMGRMATVGLAVVLLLFLIVSYKDIIRFNILSHL